MSTVFPSRPPAIGRDRLKSWLAHAGGAWATPAYVYDAEVIRARELAGGADGRVAGDQLCHQEQP